MNTQCAQCGTKLEGSQCWKCGAAALRPRPRPRSVAFPIPNVDRAVVKAGLVSVIAGIGLFVLPLLGLLVAAVTLVALAVVFRTKP